MDDKHVVDMHVDETARKYTYADYEKIDDDKRYEVIDGVIYLMASPSAAHQRISQELSFQLVYFLRGKPCQVFSAPFDVCLNAAGDNDRTVVQPDILVICDRKKIEPKRCNGAPDLVIEILSPSTTSRDMSKKFIKYQNAGVREYWIVNPESKYVHVCVLTDGEYEVTDYSGNVTIPVNILEGCEIDFEHVFADIEDIM